MRDDSERLKDILDAIAQIERYSLQGRDRFEQATLRFSYEIKKALS
jgi:uncharacterized protein with HEPN domain